MFLCPKARQGDGYTQKREEGRRHSWQALLGCEALLPSLLMSSNRVDSWAALPTSFWLRWTGAGVALLGFALLQWAQTTLGKSWSDTPRMIREQALVTSGPYQFIRHPIYTAFILILGSTLLISANWFIGLAWIGMTVLEITSRIGFEENLMLEYFGDQYRQYMKNGGYFRLINN
jgi:protein-S-isoprenylcysteine O-methyltransferase Ste14